jgi:DNA-binding response OmpR family regulator
MPEAARPADMLVLEDDPDIRQCLARLLQREGYAVAVTPGGWRALGHVRRRGAASHEEGARRGFC